MGLFGKSKPADPKVFQCQKGSYSTYFITSDYAPRSLLEALEVVVCFILKNKNKNQGEGNFFYGLWYLLQNSYKPSQDLLEAKGETQPYPMVQTDIMLLLYNDCFVYRTSCKEEKPLYYMIRNDKKKLLLLGLNFVKFMHLSLVGNQNAVVMVFIHCKQYFIRK